MCNRLSIVDLSTSIGKLVFGKDICTYKEVIDDFDNAEYIFISTFNISSRSNELLNQLKYLKNVNELIFLSNIPKRYESYYFTAAEQKAHQNINQYLQSLDPMHFASPTKVFFNFNNHCKIVMTDKVAYIGSANFSDESNNNFEIGVVIRDRSIIDNLRKNIVPQLLDESVRYAGKEISVIRNTLNNYLDNICSALEKLDENLYQYDEHNPSRRYFDVYQAYIDKKAFEELKTLISIFKEYINKDVIFNKYESLREISWWSVINVAEDMLQENFIQSFLNFDEQSIMDNYLEENAMLAQDEELEKYCQKASEKVVEEKEELAEEVEKALCQLNNSIEELKKTLYNGLKELWDIERTQAKIDNT